MQKPVNIQFKLKFVKSNGEIKTKLLQERGSPAIPSTMCSHISCVDSNNFDLVVQWIDKQLIHKDYFPGKAAPNH